MMKTKLAVLFLGAAVISTFTTAAAASEAPFVHMAVQAADSATIVVNAPRGRVDTAVFGKRPFMRSPRLSPDGTKIAVMMTKDGVDFLGYIDATKPGSAPVFFAQAEEFREAGVIAMEAGRFLAPLPEKKKGAPKGALIIVQDTKPQKFTLIPKKKFRPKLSYGSPPAVPSKPNGGCLSNRLLTPAVRRKSLPMSKPTRMS